MKTTAALANPRGGWLRAGESSRARAPARPRDSRGPAGRAPSRVHPATRRAPRPRSRRTFARRARPRRPPHRSRAFSSHSHADALRPRLSPPAAVQVQRDEGSAAEAANVSDRPRESSPPNASTLRLDRRRFARARSRRVRVASRGERRRGGEGPKNERPNRPCLFPSRDFPNPSARDPRRARPERRGDPRGPFAEPKTDPSVPSIAKQSDQPTIGGGYNLLKRIRRVYAHDERPYHAFLAILIRFRNAEFTTEQVRPGFVSPPKTSETAPIEPPGVFSIVDGIREAASVARDRSRRPFPATRQPAPRGN